MDNKSNRIISTIESISSLAGHTGMVGIFAMLLLTNYDIFSRYVFNKPVLFSDEIGGYLLVFMCFMGSAITLKEGRHIAVDILIERLGPNALNRIKIITSFVSLVVLIVFFYHSIIMVYRSFIRDLHVPSVLWTPLWIPQILIPIGTAILILQMAVEIYKSIKALQK